MQDVTTHNTNKKSVWISFLADVCPILLTSALILLLDPAHFSCFPAALLCGGAVSDVPELVSYRTGEEVPRDVAMASIRIGYGIFFPGAYIILRTVQMQAPAQVFDCITFGALIVCGIVAFTKFWLFRRKSSKS